MNEAMGRARTARALGYVCAALIALIASCHNANGESCTNDADCPTGMICVYPFPGCDVRSVCMIEQRCSFEGRAPCEAPNPVCACSGGTSVVHDRASASYMPFPIRSVGACSDGGVQLCPLDVGSLPTGTCDIDLTCTFHVHGFCPCPGDVAPADQYTCTCAVNGPWSCTLTSHGQPACAHGQDCDAGTDAEAMDAAQDAPDSQ